MIRSLTLVRHGESQWNAVRLIQGHLDSPLSEEGRAQARALSARFQPDEYDCVFSSDLSRALETGRLALGNDAEIILEPRLREHCFGRWQGLSPEEVQRRFPEEWSRYRADPLSVRPEGGESVTDLRDRVAGLLDEWHERLAGERVLVFTHGGVVRVSVMLALGLPLSPWGRLRVPNASVTSLEFRRDGARLLCFGSVGHLEAVKLVAGTAEEVNGDAG
ncbi:MAG: phosphoglycerate mutase [Armatimonadota bacterium]|nr:MAG: phosphoglycerate mutase [Armatimonadota bacterium]